MKDHVYGYILNSKISAISFQESILKIEDWIKKGEKKYICVCNTHSLVTATNNDKFAKALETADMCTPDGMPLVWALRLLGFKNQQRIDGPNLMLELCRKANEKGYKIFLYGNKEEVLNRLENILKKNYPQINIVGSYSPPFKEELSEIEREEIVKLINDKNPDIVFVSLGCPKQELWMYDNRKFINGIKIGVGAAFNYIIGDIKRPPKFVQDIGFEWFYRLVCEPRRLWKRYLYNNTLYILKYLFSYKKDLNSTKKDLDINSYNTENYNNFI